MIYKFNLLILSVLFSISSVLAENLAEKLASLSKAFNFTYKAIETDTFFTEKYILYFTQYLDHHNPEGMKFQQRVYLAHRGFDEPVVFITEGYAAEYAAHPRYINELSSILNSNQVCVEHRFFGESLPENMDWQYLTVFNAASDHHRIVEVLKKIYPGSWVSTGISKGGQTTMYHRYFYPTDVVASVGYVCPLNFSIEDQRVYRFLEQVGDPKTKEKVENYQKEMLKNKATYLPEFEKLAQKKNLTYKMGLEKAYELTVLEYSFAYWQWGTTAMEDIPYPAGESEKMVNHLDKVAGINWISDEGIKNMQPFFYQALTEIGFYGYNIFSFKDWVSYSQNPVFDFTAPDNVEAIYNPEPMIAVDRFIRHEAENMIFIYGETDPWSSTGVDLTYNNNLLKIVKPGGSHLTRIGNLPEDQQKLVIQTLKTWLNSSK